MTRNETFRGSRRHSRGGRRATRPNTVRLLLEQLEDRLPPGDVLLGLLLGPAWFADVPPALGIATVGAPDTLTPAPPTDSAVAVQVWPSYRPASWAAEHGAVPAPRPTGAGEDFGAAQPLPGWTSPAPLPTVRAAVPEPSLQSVLGAVSGPSVGLLPPAVGIGNARPQVVAGDEAALAALRERYEQLPLNAGPRAAASSTPNAVDLGEGYGRIPLSFEANRGQTDARVQFLSRGVGYTLFLTGNEAVFSLQKPVAAEGAAGAETPGPAGTVLRMQLIGANPAPQAVGLEALPGRANYFRGNDPAGWQTNISTYAKVEYQGVYPGVNLVYYGNQRQLEYDFLVAPGADPGAIRLNFEGADRLEIDARGDLLLTAGAEQIRQHKPIAYQELNGVHQRIDSSYVLTGQQQVGLQLAAYDPGRPLVIDPVLSYSTYLGGSGGEMLMGIAVDDGGSAYVTGMTNSVDFPAHGGYQGGLMDTVVSKLSPDGSALVYSTYLGGSDFDLGEGIAVDSAGNAYVSGMTSSVDFPVTEKAFQSSHGGGEFDAFVTKLNADGTSLVYSSYLGGGDQEGTRSLMIPSTSKSLSIVVDAEGSAYVKARTMSQDFPTTPGAFQTSLAGVSDSTVTKVNQDGSALVFSTYFGGSGEEFGKPLALDAEGNVFLAGRTRSTDDFPVLNAFQPTFGGGAEDAYVAKLNPHGSALIFSTYFGGSVDERAFGIGVDALGNAYASGLTTSLDFPTVNPLQAEHAGGSNDMWMAKFAGDGDVLFSTYWGGSGLDAAWDSVVDAAGNMYVVGRTGSTDFPVVKPVQSKLAGELDVAIVSLDSTGSAVRYSTYLGGSLTDTGFRIAVDPDGNAYVTGWTTSTDFPTANPLQPESAGQHDGFVAKIAV